MRVHEALVGVSRLFLDTAPVIYFVERHSIFADRVDLFFERLDLDIQAVVSPVTLAECIVGAKQQGLINLEQAFVDMLQQETVLFVDTNAAIASNALHSFGTSDIASTRVEDSPTRLNIRST